MVKWALYVKYEARYWLSKFGKSLVLYLLPSSAGEISMSAVCGYIEGPAGSEPVFDCPGGGISGTYLAVQIINNSAGTMLTLCEVYVNPGE